MKKCDEDSDSDSGSDNSDSDDDTHEVAPINQQQLDASIVPLSSGAVGSLGGTKRPLAVDRDDDKVSSVSRVSISAAGSSKTSKRTKNQRRMPHWTSTSFLQPLLNLCHFQK